jgi:hypothetical protein
MIKRVAVECKNASNGFSEILGTLSALFNLEDFRATFIARVLGFLTSSDSRMCAHALAYLNKCTQLRDGISFAILSDARVIASTCNLLRFKISDTDVVESVLRTLSFVLGSIDTVDASVWGALFECFGASQHGSFSDKLGILLPANSTLKSIAADIIVSTLCIPGGYQLIIYTVRVFAFVLHTLVVEIASTCFSLGWSFGCACYHGPVLRTNT